MERIRSDVTSGVGWLTENIKFQNSIISNAPTERLAIWLLEKFKSLPIQFESASVKNSIDLVNKIKNTKIADNEIQVSFDVESLFPNVPIDITLQILHDWLVQNGVHDIERAEIINLTRICMSESWFQFNGKFYKQNFGCCMGSPLSPFLANLFLSNFETEMKKNAYFPRIWHRYVDDVYAVIKKHLLRQFLNQLNNTKYTTIKFTHEVEDNGKINFLDLVLIRNDGILEFDIFRKPTNTGRYITSDSFHSFQHKISCFHSMIYRAFNVPMNEERFNNEIKRIKDIANLNGYTDHLINELIVAHKRKRELRNHTNLSLITSDEVAETWSGFAHHPELIGGIKPIFNQHNIKIGEFSEMKLKHSIGGSKDKIEAHHNSGIYAIKCNDCNKEYIGQSRRAIIMRYGEHDRHITNEEPEKSRVAKHMIENGHKMSIANLKLLHRVNKCNELDAYESYYINRNKNNSMNENDGPIYNSIFGKFDV
ncbi:uncharacterized protein LOC116347852 [Contarinia nasturtii]|uniref:uncharacterized protein LOC116347852 n=1 Tax=Contarinia nasturtii TaxID=265458 RepID=UPI0012D3C353|nr:uncharacterized protein LOC116347852 [Contarinia nasturtii]